MHFFQLIMAPRITKKKPAKVDKTTEETQLDLSSKLAKSTTQDEVNRVTSKTKITIETHQDESHFSHNGIEEVIKQVVKKESDRVVKELSKLIEKKLDKCLIDFVAAMSESQQNRRGHQDENNQNQFESFFPLKSAADFTDFMEKLADDEYAKLVVSCNQFFYPNNLFNLFTSRKIFFSVRCLDWLVVVLLQFQD